MGVAEKRRLKKKLAKEKKKNENSSSAALTKTTTTEKEKKSRKGTPTVEVEYVAAPLETILDADVSEEMRRVFEAFVEKPANKNGEKTLENDRIHEEKKKTLKKKTKKTKKKNGNDDEKEVDDEFSSSSSDDADSDDDEKNNTEDGLTRKQRKEMKKLQIADLKRVCEKPEVVEIWDTTAQDPEFLVYIKASRNAVPVPRHWSQKRAFLAGKRGIEKPPFKLPAFIEATGIAKLRDSYAEREEQKSLKSKVKDTKTAKLGRIDIDYQVMHDAFFKFQTKPKMTKMGDLYFEGKEYEISLGDRKPGNLSDELKAALGIDGNNGPPPWLINMQRYGPPPAYPKLPIPGLSAPIPEGAQFGYHPGGWGKPPVDEYGRALYGDVFGINAAKQTDRTKYDEPVMKGDHFFGELGSDDEESESEEESEDEEEAEEEEVEEEEEVAVEEEEEEEEEERRTILKKKKKRKKRNTKNDSKHEDALKAAEGVQKARTQICVQLSALRRSQAYLDTYTLDGWRSSNQEKLKPIAELAKKREDIFFRKLKVRELFEKLNYDEKKLEKFKCKEDEDGEIECEDVVCCECGSGECNEEENDVVFCDGYCDLAYHMKCVKPPLKPEDIPKGDEGWLCPLCDCRVDVIYYLNLDYDQRLDIETCTHLDVFKKEQDMFDKGIIPGTSRFHLHGENEEDVWPSDESEDEDFKEKNEKDDGKDDSDESLSGSAVVPQSSSASDDSENSSSSSSSDSAIIIEGPRRRTKVDYVKLNGDLFGDAVLDGDEEEKQDAKVKPMADRRTQLAALVALNKKEKNQSSSGENKKGKAARNKTASPVKTKGTQRNGNGGNNRRRKRRGRETTTTTTTTTKATKTKASALLSSKSTKANEKKKKKKMKMNK